MAPSRRTRSAYFAVKQEFREEENALQSPTPLTCVAGAARPSVIKTEAATSAVTVESSTLASDTPTTAVACAAIPAAVDARSSSVPQQGEGQARRTPAEGRRTAAVRRSIRTIKEEVVSGPLDKQMASADLGGAPCGTSTSLASSYFVHSGTSINAVRRSRRGGQKDDERGERDEQEQQAGVQGRKPKGIKKEGQPLRRPTHDEGSRTNASASDCDTKPAKRRVRAGVDGNKSQRQTRTKRVKIEKREEGEVKTKTKGKRATVKKEVEKEAPRVIPPRLAEKAELIVQVMNTLYPDPPIPINHVDSFTLLCGVLLSAQTTDGQVNEVTRELFRVAPDPLSLSKMTQESVQKIVRSVGLAPTKAKHLIALSRQLLERFDGRVPDTFEGLQSLPGVGRKTAAVVMAQAFGVPAFPVDTHIHRLALRWGLTKIEKNASKVEQDLKALFPIETWSKLHLQFIYFGREHCQARIHETNACPICCWIKKIGPGAPKVVSDLTCLRELLACPTPPRKSSKNAIMYGERLLEMKQFKMRMEDSLR